MLKKMLILASIGFLTGAGAAYAATPFGGDDTGFLPPGGTKSAYGKCQVSISKAASKALSCIMRCHDSRASGKLADETAEEACETANDGKSCLAKYFKSTTSAVAKGGCPPCSVSTVSLIAATTEAIVDGQNELIYCSPSGAFIDGGSTY
jgi:hypothetical protein